MSGAPAENALRHTPLSGSALKLLHEGACSASIFDAMVLLSTYGVRRYCVKTVIVQEGRLLLLCPYSRPSHAKSSFPRCLHYLLGTARLTLLDYVLYCLVPAVFSCMSLVSVACLANWNLDL